MTGILSEETEYLFCRQGSYSNPYTSKIFHLKFIYMDIFSH